MATKIITGDTVNVDDALGFGLWAGAGTCEGATVGVGILDGGEGDGGMSGIDGVDGVDELGFPPGDGTFGGSGSGLQDGESVHFLTSVKLPSQGSPPRRAGI